MVQHYGPTLLPWSYHLHTFRVSLSEGSEGVFNLKFKFKRVLTAMGTVAMLKEKQKQEQSPFIVLSGSNKGLTA